MTLYGGVEAGGTKFVCAVGTGPGDLRAVDRFPTTTPALTIARVIDFFQRQPEPVSAMGMGLFFNGIVEFLQSTGIVAGPGAGQ